MMALLDDPIKRRLVRQACLGRDMLLETRSHEDGFRAHLALCGASERTQSKYMESVRLFRKRTHLLYEEATEEQVGGYLARQRERGIAKETWRGYRFALQAFYRDYLGRDWSLFDKPLRGPDRRSVVREITKDEFRRAWRFVREPIHAGVIGLCWSCGLRISEACAVRPKDITRDGQVRIMGKGGHERLVPVPPRALDYLRALWAGHRNPDWLFPRKDGQTHISADVVSHTWQYVRKAAGLTHPYGLHSLRHAYASRLYEADVPEDIIRQVLGHADVNTTRRYIHVTEAQRARVIAALA